MTAACPLHCHHGVGTWGPAVEGWNRSAKGVTGANLRGELRRRVQEKWQIESEWLQQSWKGDVSTKSEWRLSLLILFFFSLNSGTFTHPVEQMFPPVTPCKYLQNKMLLQMSQGGEPSPKFTWNLKAKNSTFLKWSLPSSPLSCPLGELMAGQCLFNY